MTQAIVGQLLLESVNGVCVCVCVCVYTLLPPVCNLLVHVYHPELVDLKSVNEFMYVRIIHTGMSLCTLYAHVYVLPIAMYMYMHNAIPLA